MPDSPQLNAAQQEAVTHGEGPLLIVAGAGTGKTTVITERIVWLIMEQGVAPDRILAMTFTDKAAQEMVERVDRRLPYGYVDLWISTFHAFAERVLREHAIDIGLDPAFRVLNETEGWLLVRRHLDEFDLDYYRPLGNPTKFIQAMLRHFSRCKDEAISPEEYLQYAEKLKLDLDEDKFIKKGARSKKQGARSKGKGNRDKGLWKEEEGGSEAARITEIATAYHTYQRIMRESGNLDFGDLLTELLRLFRERPKILDFYRAHFHYFLVDEFQDTNWAQYELIKLLAAPKNNLTVVGDDDQSIYKFRGASVANILEFQKDFPKSAQIVLTENFRTKQNILDLAYTFIQQNNPNRLEAKLGVSARRSGHVLAKPVSKKLTAQRTGEGTLELLTYQSGQEEVRGVLERIAELKMKETLGWGDFAILVRANDHAQPFVQACERAGIPVQFVARRGLFLKPLVIDLTAYLRLLDNYHESTAMYRVLSWPAFRLPPDDLALLTEYARRKAVSLFASLKIARSMQGITPKTYETIDHLLGFLERHAQLAREKTASEVLYAVLQDTGYLKRLSGQETGKSAQDLATLNEFFGRVVEYEHSGEDPTVRGLLSFLTLSLESGDAGEIRTEVEEGPDALKIMTVHGAKGLEFPYVFVANLVERRFPSTERRDPIEIPEALVREILPEGDWHLQEERRLLYVACTRARDGLFFTHAEAYGGSRAKRPSPFLYELGLLTKEVAQPPQQQTSLLGAPPKLPIAHRGDPFEQRVVAAHNDFSFTQLIAYANCPWQYRFAHVLRVPIRPNWSLSFGKTMHATLYHFFHLLKERAENPQNSLFAQTSPPARGGVRGGGSPTVSLEELLALYDKNWIDEWYQNQKHQDEYRKKGREALKAFYESHQGHFPIPLYLEQNFSVKLEDYSLKGTIDRIDVLTEGAEIIDYKTGRYKDKLERRDRYQLLIYALAASDPQVLNLRVEKLSFYFIEENKKNSRAPEARDPGEVTAWAQGLIAKIKSGDFTPTPGIVCKFCDFREICDFRAI